jgi:hypothetical protein
MTVEALLLAATTLIALVAAVVAVVAVRTVRRLEQQVSQSVVEVPTPVVEVAASAVGAPPACGGLETTATVGGFEADFVGASTTDVSSELAPRVVQGRVVVPPSQAQVVRTALGRPGVRLTVFVHGVARALRPENRDRIVALMRREYRHRRSQRLSAGRQAVRMARPASAPSTDRLHERLLEPKPLSLTDRMTSS